MSIFEILRDREMNPNEEFHRLVQLFNIQFWEKNEKISVKDFIDGVLHNLAIRGTYLLVDEMLKDLGINENQYHNAYWKELFLYCELMKNLLEQAKSFIDSTQKVKLIAPQINENISRILEKTGHDWAKIPEGFVIVDKNPAATEAIECLQSGADTVAFGIIEYNRVLLKGDVERKRSILIRLANYTEPMKKDLIGTLYYNLYDSTRHWVNKLDVRHNNSGKEDLPEYAKKWTERDFEEWYDKIYHSLLMVIMAKRQLEIDREFKKLKSNTQE